MAMKRSRARAAENEYDNFDSPEADVSPEWERAVEAGVAAAMPSIKEQIAQREAGDLGNLTPPGQPEAKEDHDVDAPGLSGPAGEEEGTSPPQVDINPEDGASPDLGLGISVNPSSEAHDGPAATDAADLEDDVSFDRSAIDQVLQNAPQDPPLGDDHYHDSGHSGGGGGGGGRGIPLPSFGISKAIGKGVSKLSQSLNSKESKQKRVVAAHYALLGKGYDSVEMAYREVIRKNQEMTDFVRSRTWQQDLKEADAKKWEGLASSIGVEASNPEAVLGYPNYARDARESHAEYIEESDLQMALSPQLPKELGKYLESKGMPDTPENRLSAFMEVAGADQLEKPFAPLKEEVDKRHKENPKLKKAKERYKAAQEANATWENDLSGFMKMAYPNLQNPMLCVQLHRIASERNISYEAALAGVASGQINEDNGLLRKQLSDEFANNPELSRKHQALMEASAHYQRSVTDISERIQTLADNKAIDPIEVERIRHTVDNQIGKLSEQRQPLAPDDKEGLLAEQFKGLKETFGKTMDAIKDFLANLAAVFRR